MRFSTAGPVFVTEESIGAAKKVGSEEEEEECQKKCHYMTHHGRGFSFGFWFGFRVDGGERFSA